LVCGKAEDRWLSEDNQRDDNAATRQHMTLGSVWIDSPSGEPEGQAERKRASQKNQLESPVIYERWYKPLTGFLQRSVLEQRHDSLLYMEAVLGLLKDGIRMGFKHLSRDLLAPVGGQAVQDVRLG